MNDYNQKIRNKVLPKLSNYPEVREYLLGKTLPFEYSHFYPYCSTYIDNEKVSVSSTIKHDSLLIFAAAFLFIYKFIL